MKNVVVSIEAILYRWFLIFGVCFGNFCLRTSLARTNNTVCDLLLVMLLTFKLLKNSG